LHLERFAINEIASKVTHGHQKLCYLTIIIRDLYSGVTMPPSYIISQILPSL